MIMGEFDWKKNKHVVIPQGTKLTERMFQRNHSVETITLPDDIDSLPDYFCFDCKRLKAIYGGRNIKIISIIYSIKKGIFNDTSTQNF